MKEDETKEELIKKLAEIRKRISELEEAAKRHKQVEKALRESEERFRQVARSAGEWIWEVDADGLYTYSSPVVEKILGYKPEEIVGKKHFYDLFHPEDREGLKKAALQTFVKRESFHSFVNRNITKKGETVWFSTSGVPMIDEKGNLLGYRGSDTDITERKKTEEALRESEQKFRNLESIYELNIDTVKKDIELLKNNSNF